MEKRPLKIILGDVRHKTVGRHSTFMPLGIGLIASYAFSRFSEDVNVHLYDDPEKLFADLSEIKPDIVGLSNYCWNSELNRLVFKKAKSLNPSVITIAGGPEFPLAPQERKHYLLERPEIDFFCYAEGEVAFSKLTEKVMNGCTADDLKKNPHENMISVHPHNGDLVVGPFQRIPDLNIVPSPYLTGIMDQWFTGEYSPSIQTTRGCPFTCGYCWAGNHFKDLKTFSLNRLKEELEYIAVRMKNYPFLLLSMVDSNFGMYERDEEIADYIRELWEKYGWPTTFDTTMGKTNYDRIMRVSDKLNNRITITCSLQSTNPQTLEAVRRKNLPRDEYIQIQYEIRKRGMWSVTEMIMPLPFETKDSFIDGMKFVIDNDVEVSPYTLMLLKGTDIASEENRKKFDMLSKFRLIPRQFGEYEGAKCFEIEEVCVGTNTMSFEDYCELRGLSFVMTLYSHKQYDMIFRLVKESGSSISDFILYVWDMIKRGNTGLSELYQQYLDEVINELWDSPEHIYTFYSKEENYKKLLSGELGDNLIRKYRMMVFIEKFQTSVELAFRAIPAINNHDLTDDMTAALKASEDWIIAIRNIGDVLENKHRWNSVEPLSLPFDVQGWYESGSDSRPLVTYKKKADYLIRDNADRLETIYMQTQKLYGTDETFQIGKVLINYPVQDLWRICKSV